jgi:hypothetical protein
MPSAAPARCSRAALVVASSFVPALLFAVGPAAAGFDDLAGTKPGELAGGLAFDGADACALCHGGGFGGDRSYLPHDSWAGTMMANAARDPVFRAALAVANQDEPGVGTFCLRCHSPIAFVRGHATPPDGSAFDAIDDQGIGCDTCHRAAAAGPPEAPYFRGDAQLVYTDELDKRGPYPDSVAHVHGVAFDEALSSAHFCGQCHQVTNPGRRLRDAAGVETPLAFPLDTTYEEWAQSAFSAPDGKTCLDCHTQRKSGVFPVATVPGAPARTDPRGHAFVGANLFGIRAVMASSPERAAAFPDAFALALARTEEVLASAVGVEITSAPNVALPGADLDVRVRVENLGGHKFPTGYAEGRRAWIALALASPGGEEKILLGGYDAVTGEIASEPPTHIYRAQHGRWNGTSAEPGEDLARHDMILVDTRIPPKGFVPTTTTKPTSEIDYGDGAGGVRHWDEAVFVVKAPEAVSGKAILSARVYYQPITRKYVEHLAATNVTDSSGQELLAIYDAVGASPPFLVASAEAVIDFGSGSGNGSGNGSGGGGGGGSGSGIGDTGRKSCDCAVPGRPDASSHGGWGFCVAALILSFHRRQEKR